MPMNKKEKAYLESLEIMAALRHTEGAEKDVMPPSTGFGGVNKLSKGFVFNSYSLRVEPACSSSVCHGRGQTERTTAQNSIKMFSTEALAYKAMRKEVELRCAKELRAIDRKILAMGEK